MPLLLVELLCQPPFRDSVARRARRFLRLLQMFQLLADAKNSHGFRDLAPQQILHDEAAP